MSDLLCSYCWKRLPPDRFYRANMGHTHRAGRSHECIECCRTRKRESWRAKNPGRPQRVAA